MDKLKEYLLEQIIKNEKNFDLSLSNDKRQEILNYHYNELESSIDDLIYDAVWNEVE